jgi:hypothetical protein
MFTSRSLDCILLSSVGQCANIADRASSPWWNRHIKSFASRQIETYERELGWLFEAYKLDEQTEASHPSAVYWSFRMAAAAGFIDLSNISPGCAHKPVADFAIGDDSYAPTTQPFQWYWIPPPPTPVPTFAPTVTPPLIKDDTSFVYGSAAMGILVALSAIIGRIYGGATQQGYAPIPQGPTGV